MTSAYNKPNGVCTNDKYAYYHGYEDAMKDCAAEIEMQAYAIKIFMEGNEWLANQLKSVRLLLKEKNQMKKKSKPKAKGKKKAY